LYQQVIAIISSGVTKSIEDQSNQQRIAIQPTNLPHQKLDTIAENFSKS
jgi:hypothetical protein